jgi:hypothetical protein
MAAVSTNSFHTSSRQGQLLHHNQGLEVEWTRSRAIIRVEAESKVISQALPRKSQQMRTTLAWFRFPVTVFSTNENNPLVSLVSGHWDTGLCVLAPHGTQTRLGTSWHVTTGSLRCIVALQLS